MLLHVLYPALEWNPAGAMYSVPLVHYIGRMKKKKTIANLVVRVTEGPFTIQEFQGMQPGDQFGVNLFAVTKISGGGQTHYVVEYAADILFSCCGSDANDSFLWIDWDDNLFLNETNGGIYYL